MPVRDFQLLLTHGATDSYGTVFDCWDNLRNVFSEKIGNSLQIDGVSKISVSLGEPDPDGFVIVSDISEIHLGGFSLDDYLQLSGDQQDRIALQYMVEGVSRFAALQGVDAAPVRRAAEATIADGFTHQRPLKNGCRMHPSRRLRASTHILFRKGDGGASAVVEIHDRQGVRIASEATGITGWFNRDWLNTHWRSRWDGHVFELTHNYQREVRTFRSRDYAGALAASSSTGMPMEQDHDAH